MRPFQRLLCAVRGHEGYLHFEKNRVYLECVACGYESPGWSISKRSPKTSRSAAGADGPQIRTFRAKAA